MSISGCLRPEFQRQMSAKLEVRVVFVCAAGITAESIPKVRQLGFAGAAVLGSVWSSEDPVATCAAMLESCRQA